MKEQSQLERKLDELGRCLKGAPSIVDSVMHRVGQTRIAPCAPVAEKVVRGSAGRLLMRVGKLAVAAVACVIVLAAWWLLSRSEVMPSAYAELTDAVKNSKSAEWVHWQESSTGRWFSARPPRAVWVFPDGDLRYIDYESNRCVSYTPDNRTITISWEQRREEVEGVASLWDAMLGEIERRKEKGDLLEVSSGEVGGRPCRVFALATEEGHGRLFMDMERRRLLRTEVLQPDGEARIIDFEYPAHGPENIYELGAPRDARVVDLTGPTEVKELKEKVDEAARVALPEYYAIVCKRMKDDDIAKGEGLPVPRASISVIYAKGDRKRVETYVPACPEGMTYTESLNYHKVLWDELPPEDMEALKAWVAARKPYEVVFWEGSGKTEIKLDTQGKLTRRERNGFEGSPPAEPLIWCMPIELGNGRALEPKDGEWGRLVGFESFYSIRYKQWYFNPGRDYVCEFCEWGSDNQREILEPGHQVFGDPYRHTSTLKLDEYARTPKGSWYPRKETQVDYRTGYGEVTYVIINHVDDTRPVPDELLNPDSVTAEMFQAPKGQ